MNWKLILKDPGKQPLTGVYSDWKEIIAEECYHQCVYCSIHEQQFGGIDHYHVEHFRPKSLPQFEDLENDILNLYYACPICNRFKSNDWPADPDDIDSICYPDPSSVNYAILFEIDNVSFNLKGKYLSSKYIIEKLYLNRPQLIYERRETILVKRGLTLIDDISIMIQSLNDPVMLREAFYLLADVISAQHKRGSIRPYTIQQIRKS